MRGAFITFEGVEGAGKTTQARLLRDHLLGMGLRCQIVREPGGEPTAEAIRGLLLAAQDPVTARAELLLFAAARAQLVERVVLPALREGVVVLCDRYADSTVAYQGHARGHDVAFVRSVNVFATGGLSPDLTLLLDLPADEGLRRQPDRNRMEREPLEFHRRVREGYLAEAEREPARFTVIDARLPAEGVHAEIVRRALAVADPARAQAPIDPQA
ncbi:MAG: dTMP kinase [Chthonomonadales bacterium]|nr:dTMP kinase [Chthonomonadales bacterium]